MDERHYEVREGILWPHCILAGNLDADKISREVQMTRSEALRMRSCAISDAAVSQADCLGCPLPAFMAIMPAPSDLAGMGKATTAVARLLWRRKLRGNVHDPCAFCDQGWCALYPPCEVWCEAYACDGQARPHQCPNLVGFAKRVIAAEEEKT